jgi:hypothetical protein
MRARPVPLPLPSRSSSHPLLPNGLALLFFLGKLASRLSFDWPASRTCYL